jgi:hypothetical protein
MGKTKRDSRDAAGLAELEKGDVGTWLWDPRPDADGWVELERRLHPQGLERIRVRVQPDENGLLELRELHFLDLGEPITARRLRALRLGALDLMVSAAAATSGPKPQSDTLAPPSSRGYSDEFYDHVADVYRAALARDARPVVSIMAEAGVPRSTAARWVKEARRRGRLGPARAPGKAGA